MGTPENELIACDTEVALKKDHRIRDLAAARASTDAEMMALAA